MGKERIEMIFEEKKDGIVIRIPHKEMMNEDETGFILTILHGRAIYQKNKKQTDEEIIKKSAELWADANLDDDNPEDE